MLFRWFDARAAEEFGLKLAETYAGKYSESLKVDKKTLKKQLRLTRETFARAQQFNTSHNLNFYQKAKMGNAFKWKLRDMGCDLELIDALTKDLMVALR